MTWRERIQAAREREQLWFWRRWRERHNNVHFPFTYDDLKAWSSVKTCLAAEVAMAYGLDIVTGAPLFGLGDTFLRSGAFDSADAAERFLDAIEDRALQLKREQA